jgi:hypothetical protein
MQFVAHALLIDGLQKPGTDGLMNLNGGADDLFRKFVVNQFCATPEPSPII